VTRREDLEPVRGEVVELPSVEARPVVRRERAVVESVAGLPVEQRHVTNNYYVQDVEPVRESVPPWVRVLALVICLAAAVYLTVVVLAYLHVGGPWDVAPHVKGTGR
jgi:hypothetical protein